MSERRSEADTDSPEPLLQLDDLQVRIALRRGAVRALNGVDLTVQPGQTLGVVGESGSGKTMTALSVMGLLPAAGRVSGGSIRFGGRDLTTLDPAQLRAVRGTEIGMIFQDPLTSLNPTMRIGRQIAEALLAHARSDRAGARDTVIDTLRKVGMPRPERIFEAFPHELSGGMRQRAMIAMALVNSPRLLIADEPTTALDVTTQRQILDLIDELKAELGMAVILVTHDLGVVAGRADQVAVMYGGRVVEQGPSAEIFDAPQHQYTRALLAALPDNVDRDSELYSIPGMPPDLSTEITGCAFAPRCHRADEQCRTTDPELVPTDRTSPESAVVHAHACHHPAGPAPSAGQVALPDPVMPSASQPGAAAPEASAEVLLRVSNLVKNYAERGRGPFGRGRGTVQALSGISLEVRRGETLGVVGESGCGKSTLGRIVADLESPTDGTVELSGVQVTTMSGEARRRLHRQVQLMFQDSQAAIDPRMRIDAVLNEPLDIQSVGNRRDRERRITGLLDDVGMPANALERYPHEFSGGQLQRVGLARSLALEPTLVVCDEPVSALDVSVQAQVLNLMRQIQRDRGLTYLLISHDLSVVSYMADRIAVLYLGKLVEQGPAEDVVNRPRHPYTKVLIDAAPRAHAAAAGDGTQLRVVGEPGSAVDPPSGCRFRTRCPLAGPECEVEPELVGDSHQVACHHRLDR